MVPPVYAGMAQRRSQTFPAHMPFTTGSRLNFLETESLALELAGVACSLWSPWREKRKFHYTKKRIAISIATASGTRSRILVHQVQTSELDRELIMIFGGPRVHTRGRRLALMHDHRRLLY